MKKRTGQGKARQGRSGDKIGGIVAALAPIARVNIIANKRSREKESKKKRKSRKMRKKSSQRMRNIKICLQTLSL